MKKDKGRKNVKNKRERTTRSHYLSPITPPKEILEFKATTDTAQGGQRTNNVQEISIETDYSLYPSPDKPVQNHPINIIYDTGAAILMLPAEYTHVRERPQLHPQNCF
jgi:hypothetical protein